MAVYEYVTKTGARAAATINYANIATSGTGDKVLVASTTPTSRIRVIQIDAEADSGTKGHLKDGAGDLWSNGGMGREAIRLTAVPGAFAVEAAAGEDLILDVASGLGGFGGSLVYCVTPDD